MGRTCKEEGCPYTVDYCICQETDLLLGVGGGSEFYHQCDTIATILHSSESPCNVLVHQANFSSIRAGIHLKGGGGGEQG